MTIERDDQQNSQNNQSTGQSQNREPTGEAQNREPSGEAQNRETTSQSQGQQPTDQQGGSGSSFQSPTGSQQGESGIADSGETLTEQGTDTETAGTTGEAQAGGFVGQERKDSGEYLQEKNESENDVEGSKNFGTNGE